MKTFLCLFATAIFFTLTSNAKVKLPALLGDNMVLQQKSSVKIWGESDKRGKVIVIPSWDKRKYVTSTNQDGEWFTQIETPTAGGPYSINISDGSTIILKNILIGEVWFCSGQSNMDMPLSGYMGQPIYNALNAITTAKETDNIRFFNVERKFNNKTEKECKGNWRNASSATLADCSAVAYFFAKHLQTSLNVPVAIIVSSWGGSQIEAWMDKETLQTQFPEVSLQVLKKDIKEIKNPRPEPTLIFNSMVNPLTNYTIKGFLWYQGESNRQNPILYSRLFPAMVQSWRSLWKSESLPFYYVQIAPYNYSHPDSLEAAHLRQAQLESLETIPNSGMAVTADIGHPTCIHPPQKDVVGSRLALQALAKTYGKTEIPFSGPMYKSVRIKDEKVILEFDYAIRGLHSDGALTGFELAGADKKFHTADALFINNTTAIQLTCPQVKKAEYLRYAYKNYGPVNVFNNWALPMCPFTAKIK
ncbi:sialate O-acetylesterase [Pseudopedobacter beijingensis]|uniref:Sialate O-acetylesterase n=1 Tax=Pseudopedobacter beijingensis TaxID=1207056 RepID=A0ABW4I8Z8_9SPHI